MTKLQEFGRKVVGKKYIFRPSAYALIQRADGAVAVAETSAGLFLLGGGQEGAESPKDALLREALEECGCSLNVGKCAAVADEFLFSTKECVYFAFVARSLLPRLLHTIPSLRLMAAMFSAGYR